ncbi:ClpP/crotonase [Clavulina sp. PMI_390]|nr:ClpP/crotonase [Clavulina sp. PMI_390]
MAPIERSELAKDVTPKSLKTTPPQHSDAIILSYPVPHVMLVTLNRPKARNAISAEMKMDVTRVFDWFENEPDLWVAIITGNGPAFCAGADLKVWKEQNATDPGRGVQDALQSKSGFAGLSRRVSSKTLIAAVNGLSMGGGTEMVVNMDIVIASEKATFALPEPRVGVFALQGAIPRLVKFAGHQKAAEMLLTTAEVSAKEAHDRFGFVNEVVPHAELIPRAIEWAKRVTALSPDSIRATKRAMNEANAIGSLEDAWRSALIAPESYNVYLGDNIKEGLRAFSERRKPQWSNPKL